MDCGQVHRPVLAEQTVKLLEPGGKKIMLDCTVGAGGHAELLLTAAGPDAQLIGMDVDEGNLRLARRRLERFDGRFRLFQAKFSQADQVLAEAGAGAADLILADLGVSSNQLDDPGRGFSFSADGPLDMRLGGADKTAADLVNTLGDKELANLIYEFGEERYSRRIARAIVRSRAQGRIERTVQLAQIVASAIPLATRRTRRGVHPATRTFLALRIAVNDELTELDRLLDLLSTILAVGGAAGIISFHSLEDRRVKQAFAKLTRTGITKLLTKKPITPTAGEVAENRRSRSAKLRGIQKIVA